jgi:hypothetical protein
MLMGVLYGWLNLSSGASCHVHSLNPSHRAVIVLVLPTSFHKATHGLQAFFGQPAIAVRLAAQVRGAGTWPSMSIPLVSCMGSTQQSSRET